MSETEKINKIYRIIDTWNEMVPYVPPPLLGTEYLFFNKNDLYMLTNSKDSVYNERLAKLLKEECDFINNVYFVKKEE
jgi:hypothetical protein